MSKKERLNWDQYKVSDGVNFSLKDFHTSIRKKDFGKDETEHLIQKDIEELASLQDILYADNHHALLIIIQALDAAGKDGTVKHIMSGVNPNGVKVTSFKSPSINELNHDYLWRHYTTLPAKGEIGIFNRSYYENVLFTKVHPDFLMNEKLAGIQSVNDIGKSFWQKRYKQICRFEENLIENDTTILKFFLNVSKEEQKKRLLERIVDPDKNWKFSTTDLQERAYWDDYQTAYEDAIAYTCSKNVPWYIIPADEKWYSRYLIVNIICNELNKLNLAYPEISDEERSALISAKKSLMNEK